MFRSTQARIPLANRFEGLYIHDVNPDEYAIEWPSLSAPSRHQASAQNEPSRPRSNRRPPVVTSIHPERDDPSVYRKRKQEPKNVTMVVDSIVKFRVRDFNSDLKDFGIENVDCAIHKFPAATASQIEDYTPRNVKANKTHGLLIHSGTNSVHQKTREGELVWTDEEIAQQILDTGIQARKDGVRIVLVSSLIVRRGKFWNRRVSNINSILNELCHQNNFIFINNQNINLSHLEDGLHLTDEGLSILKDNFLRALY